jgi:uncharacterized repeat protein (TIGR01451 family)
METTPTPPRSVLYKAILICAVCLTSASLLIGQSSTCVPDNVSNGNDDPWSEECYLNDDCAEQGNPCQANDVTLLGVFIADALGNPVPACNIGDTETVLLWGTFNNNTGTDRYSVRARTEVWINGVFETELNACSFDVLASGASDVALIGSFMYTCGDEIQLLNTWVGWETSASQCTNPMGAGFNGVCGDYSPSKCSKELGFIDFLTPNFGYDCGVATPTTTEICFENMTFGGVPPLTYLWDFGDGSTSTLENPCHTYLASSGTFIVTLTATDSNGIQAGSFLEIDLDSLVCCHLEFTCPPANAGIYTCIDDVPAPDISLITVLDSCGITSITITADTTGAGCSYDTGYVTRAYIITDGTNTDSCVQVFAIVDDTLNQIVCPSDITIQCHESTLPANTGTASATDACDGTPVIQFYDYTGTPPLSSPEMRWVLLSGNTDTGSCVSATDCESDVLCFGLQYTPNVTGTLSSYTTGFLLNCINGNDPILSNESCIMTDNSLETPDCANNIILMNSSGNTGSIPITQHVPVILHQVCFQLADGFTLTIDEDVPTDLSTSVLLPDGTPVSELPAYESYTVDQEVACPDSCLYPQIVYRQFVAIDDCGNASACVQQITFADETAPVLTCPPSITVACNTSTLPVVTGTATATDNCDVSALAVVYADVTVGVGCTANYNILRTWSATDICGNTGTCLQTIQVRDSIPPSITCPPNTTVSCANLVPAPTPGTITTSDNCSTVTVAHVSDVTINQTCVNRYTINRTYRATDACGNSATCAHQIEVNDQTPPSITCPMNVTVSCISNIPAININSVITSDNCGGPVTVIQVSDAFTNVICGNRVTVTRTYRATDACGNSATCAQIITVNDQTPPMITCPMNVTVSCASEVPAVNTASVITSDNCGGTPPTVSHVGDMITNQTCANRYVVMRTYRSTDICGNSATCVQTITVNDQTPPSITCPINVTVSCASEVPAPNTMSVTASDNCNSGVNVTHVGDVITNQTCANRYTITRTYRATDACNNSATCSQIILVNDITPPSITCPANVSVDCASMVPPVNVNDVTASDLCGGIPAVSHISDVTTSQTCINRYTVARTYQAMDACGNTATCTQTINVNDQTAPVITCPIDVTVDCVNDVPMPNTSTATASDNCGGTPVISFVGDITINQGCVNQYMISRTYRAMDECGNSATCAQLITVFDDEAPTITCPADATVECASNVPAPATVLPSSDDCGGIVTITGVNDVTVNQSCPNRYTLNRTYNAVDACGNTATCLQVITVFDDTPPTITCPLDITVDCADDVPGPATGLPASDNCGGSPVVSLIDQTTISMGCVNRFTINRTYQAMDACRNTATCVQVITVFDDTPPSVTCPDPITVTCTEDIPAPDISTVTSTDNCGGIPTIEFAQDVTFNVACADRYDISRIYVATDACGNTNSCVQIISVFDDVPPSITCPADQTLTCASEVDPIDLTAPSATDNCGGDVTISHVNDAISNQACLNRLTLTRTYRATDACGNSATCNQVFTIFDDVAPVITCPDDVTVDCTASVPAADEGSVTATDNCDGIIDISFVQDITVGQSCANQYTIQRVYSAVDICGNSATCVQQIVVNDTIAPLITCPADTTVVCQDSVPAADIATVTATDNCGDVTISHDVDVASSFVCANQYVVTRTYRATDDCGNTATCVQTITVFDDIPPVITCPDDITITATESTLPDNTGSASATDNCGSTPELSSRDVTLAGDCDGEYDIIRTWTATDACGNSSTCEQSIFVSLGCFVDLSLVKELAGGQPMTIDPGDNVTFTITVSNDGNIPVGSISVVDYIPVGFSLNDPDWTAGNQGSTGQSASIVLSIANGDLPVEGLLPGNSISVNITLATDPNLAGGFYTNVAEIAAVFGVDGTDLTNNDNDSQPDTDDANDPPTEDDHDPAILCISTDPTIVGPQAVCQGDSAVYGIETYNPAHTYTWLVGDGGMVTNTTDSSITVLWFGDLGTSSEVILIERVGDACEFSDTLVVTIGEAGPMFCIDHINLSLSNDCETVIIPSLILVGEHLNNSSYVVYVITMDGDTLPNATVTCEHVGQTFMVSVRNLCTGQSCWGNMTVEDKLPPIIDCVCAADTGGEVCTISCLLIDDILAGNIPEEIRPVVVDDCCGATIEIVNLELSYETCDTGNVVIEWLATDGMGNTSTCIQSIDVLPLDLLGLRFPVDYHGDCDDSSDPDITGRPNLNGILLDPNEPNCNIMTRYEDQVIQMCGDGRKIIRRWTVTNWCNSQSLTGIQQIFLIDEEGPVLTCSPDITISTGPWACAANVNLIPPIIVDACSDIQQIYLYGPLGLVTPTNGQYVIPNVPIGTSLIRWVVRDECNNESTCTYTVTVVDNVPPIVSCNSHTIVSLTADRPDGITLIPAESFNDQSVDNCSALTFRVARMNSCIDFDWTTGGACADDIPNGIYNGFDAGTGWAACLPVSCCDVGRTIMIALEVTDASGNSNTCMVEVEVQDKLAPSLTCPADITLSCDFPLEVVPGLYVDATGNNDGSLDEDPLSELFGNIYDAFRRDPSDRGNIIINDPDNPDHHQPHNWGLEGWALDNCQTNLSVTVSVIEDCSGNSFPPSAPAGAVKLIRRTFVGNDGIQSGSCTQRIWVVDFTPFYITDSTCTNDDPNDGVIWPCDVLITSCPDEISGTGEPVIIEDGCSLVAMTYEDTQFDFAEGACYKILREWKVIDWCQFDAATGYGLWTYVQEIKVADSDEPEFIACPVGVREICTTDPGVSLPANNQLFLGEGDPDASNCSVHVTLSQEVNDGCSAELWYDVKLYLYNGPDFIQLVPETLLELDADHNGTMSFNTATSLIPSIQENGLPYTDPLCDSNHRLVWTVEDGCGNLSVCDHLLRIEDCKPPTPVCIDGLSTVIMPMNGEVTIWASDFDASSVDDCTPNESLLFSFSGTVYEPSFTYTCDNVPEFGVPFDEEIWVADAGVDQNCNGIIEWSERNKDFCVASIIITDPNDICGQVGNFLAGEIMTEQTHAVSPVTVNLTAPGLIIPGFVTSQEGTYSFAHLPQGHDYVITPSRNDDPLNGVSTLDLVHIQKHLLGLQPFTTGYQYVAADANNSKTITAIDLLELRKLILGIIPELSDNSSWRFVKKESTALSIPPWPLTEWIDVDADEMNQASYDFTGIKVGDVNATAKANATQLLPRNADPIMKVKVMTNAIVKGQQVEYRFVLPAGTQGFQWTMETSGLTFAGIKSQAIPIDQSNVGLIRDGVITMSWNGQAVGDGEVSFVITFQVNETGNAETMVRLIDGVTAAEAYDVEGATWMPKLEFDNVTSQVDFALYQNKPNPWQDHTVIEFDLPAEAWTKLTIYDVTGKAVALREGVYKAGHNMIMLSESDIPAPGVLYYRLDSGGYSATKKMMIIR